MIGPDRKARLAFLFLLDAALVVASGWFLARYGAELVPWLRSLPVMDATVLALAASPVVLALGTAALGAYAAWGIVRAWRGEVSRHTRLAEAIGLGYAGCAVVCTALICSVAFAVACAAGVIAVASTLSLW